METKKYRLMYFLNRFPVISERELWLKAIARASGELPEAFFIVKPHPGENTEMHKRICRELGGGNIAIASPSDDTNDILFSADLTVTCNSTVGLESKLLGCGLSVVTLHFVRQPLFLLLIPSGGVCSVKW